MTRREARFPGRGDTGQWATHLKAGPSRQPADLSDTRLLVRWGFMRSVVLCSVLLLASSAPAAERKFDFSADALEQTPPEFQSMNLGKGKPGEWKVILDEVPPLLAPLSSKAPSISRRGVLAQTSSMAAAARFTALIFQGDAYRNFKLTTRFKIVSGALQQTAGLVFRFENESNFYFAGASALDQEFRCSKVVNGQGKPPIGQTEVISNGVWHDLAVECQGTRIVCSLDGKEVVKLIDAVEVRPGKIGFWTRGDTVSYFVDTAVSYQERENPATRILQDALKAYPRILGLKISGSPVTNQPPIVLASSDPKEVGQPADEMERNVIREGKKYFARPKGVKVITICAPLVDRNGDPCAAVSVKMESFPGQTEATAAVRAQPVVRLVQAHVQSVEDLTPQ